MNKIRVLSLVSAVLLLANLFLLWFVISHKGPNTRHREPKKIIIEKLQFDRHQQQQYQKLINAHREDLDQHQQKLRGLKNQLYANLSAGEQEGEVDFILNKMAGVNIEMERINYKHFQDLKQLCKPEQLVHFEQLTKDLAKLFQGPRHAK